MAFILIQLFAGASQLKAQFRIVDEQDGKPVSGAYVFSSKGTLLCISDADGNVKLQEGMVTISNLAYEPLTVDAAKEKGTVCMKPKAYTLPEVAVGKAEYVKLSGAFRDICRNNGKTILYREGLADFYINIKTGKAKRRVRACRQYELPTLRRLVNFNIAILGEARSFDISRIRFIQCDSVSGTSGDSTFYKSHYRGASADSAIIYLNSHREGGLPLHHRRHEIQPTVQSAVEREDAAVRLDVLKSQELVEFSALLPTRVQLRLPPTTNKGTHCYGGNQRLRDNRRKDHDQGGGEGGDEGPQRNRPVHPTRLSAGYTIRRGCGDKRPAKEELLGDVDVIYN